MQKVAISNSKAIEQSEDTNRVYVTFNRAKAQSRPSGFLCALAHGKLCFEYLKTFSVPENPCPYRG